jgi:hypothetical protein
MSRKDEQEGRHMEALRASVGSKVSDGQKRIGLGSGEDKKADRRQSRGQL